MMATRSGSVDPGLLLYLQRDCGVGLDELATRSRTARASSASPASRAICARCWRRRRRVAARAARLRRFIWTLRRAVGAMAGVLDGVDALVFTGGIGENSARVRRDVVAALGFAGLRLGRRRGAADDG